MSKSSLSSIFKEDIKRGKELEKQYQLESGDKMDYKYNTNTNAIPRSAGSFLSTDIPLENGAQVSPTGGDIELTRKPIYEELLKELRMKQLLELKGLDK